MSTMKVGRVSCSSNSTIPTEPSIRRGSFRSLPSGDAVRGRLERSEVLPLGTLVGPGGLNPLYVPRARLTVLTTLSSPRVLLNMVAAASELEKRAGRWGRARRALEEKKRGEVGWPVSKSIRVAVLGKLGRSRLCLVREGNRRRLCRGSTTACVECIELEALVEGVTAERADLFFPARAGGVLRASMAR